MQGSPYLGILIEPYLYTALSNPRYLVGLAQGSDYRTPARTPKLQWQRVIAPMQRRLRVLQMFAHAAMHT